MTAPTRPEFRPQPRGNGPKLLKHIKTAGAWGALLFVGFWLLSKEPRPNPLVQGPPQEFSPESAQNVELATVASVQRQQLLAAKLKQRQTVAVFDELTRDLREWERELAAWQSEGPPLLRSDEGKRLAADADLVRQVRAVFKEGRPGSETIKATRKQAEEVIFPVRESLKNAEDASPPSDFAVTTLRESQSQARNGRERYRQAREAVSVLLAQAPAAGVAPLAGVAPPAGPRTLEQAIIQLDKEETLQRVTTIEAAERKARDEATRLVAQEKAKVIQAEAEAEAQRLRDEAAQKKQASELAAAKSVEEMELKQKESAQEIDRLRHLAELQRQGDLKAGSIWKGTYVFVNIPRKGTMTIEKRVKDEIAGSIDYDGIVYQFTGTVRGNSFKIRPENGSAANQVHEAMLNPSTKTITGRGLNLSFTYRLWDGKDE
ncbi:MAG: hypothetical protein ACR2JF_10685 [Iamia sp.]